MNDRSQTALAFSTSPLALTRSHPVTSRVARLLTYGVLVSIVVMFFAPWRQSVRGEGRVVAFAPTERQQTIEAPIKGRIVRWHVREGSVVKAGDLIAELADNDPNLRSRLEEQSNLVQSGARAAKLAVAVGESRLSSIEAARRAAISSAELAVSMASDRRDAAQQDLEAATAAFATAKLNYDRQKTLEAEKLASRRKLELAKLKIVEARTKRDSAKAKLRAAKRAVGSARAKLSQVKHKEQAEVEKAKANVQKMKQEQAKADEASSKARVKATQVGSLTVKAPSDGTVLRLVANGVGHWVKPGEALAVLVPDAQSRAVEIWVSGNDAPLITPGRDVRVQFEGWPAVQFTGWPSVAVGTFGGRVALVDSADDGKGRFRVVIVPARGEQWPDARYLRQGVRVSGWVLLNEVKIGYELWRQLNGFPPAVEAPATTADKSKPRGGAK